LQLFESNESGSQFLSVLIIHQVLKENINQITEKKEDFLRFRDILLNNLLEKNKNSQGFVVERICFSISILVAMGIITFWPESIEDIINYGKISKVNCYFSIIILENVSKELFDLNISSKTSLRIKDILVERNRLIQEFILLVLTTVGVNLPKSGYHSKTVNQEEKLNNQIFNKTLEMTHAWIKLGLNVLKIPLLSQVLINYLSVDNIKYISDIFSDSIQYSTNSKYYSTNEIYDLNNIISKYDAVELKSVENLVEMIKNYLISISSNKYEGDELEILNGLANIFSTILENYINLLFMKDTLSQTLLEMLFYFISHKNRKLSYKFVESINEMREFINRGYNFNNFNNEEKLQFCNFFIKIAESVMLNCKLKNLEMNSGILKNKDCFFIEDLELLRIDNDVTLKEDLDDNGVSLADYRKSADDVFYNLFLILTYNFQDNGASYFFQWINSILSNLNINDDNISTDLSRLLVVEVTMVVVKSILDTLEISNFDSSHITNFTRTILNSKILLNENMIINFLIFLDQANVFIAKDENLFKNIVTFLINISKIKFLENISYYILLESTDYLTSPQIDSFSFVYNYYQENYDNFSPQSTTYICESLANMIGVLDKNLKTIVNLTESDIINYFGFILNPATERIKKAYEYLLINNLDKNLNIFQIAESDYNKIKIEFLKNYNVHYSILKKSYFFTKNILKGIFIIHIEGTLEITDSLFKIFVKDSNVITQLCKTYIKSIHHLGEEVVEYFGRLNEIMLNAYFNNLENMSCLSVLKFLYSDVAKGSTDKKAYISENFMNLCDVLNKNVYSMKKNQVELISLYSQFIIKILETVDYIRINKEVFENMLNLFIDAIKTIAEPNLNKDIMRTLSRILSDKKLPREAISGKFQDIIYAVFSSCDHYESSAMPDV
jgi:hypothetical protein